MIEHVAPVTEHVDDDAAVVLLAIVPRWTLRRLPIAFEHPIAEFAAHTEDAAEEAAVDQELQLHDTGQPELVLHDAVPHPGRLGAAIQIERFGEGWRHRLLGVDIFARSDRLADQRGPHASRR